MGVFERGVNSGFPAVASRWETSLYVIIFSAVFLGANALMLGPVVAQPAAKANAEQNSGAGSAQKTDAQKHPAWRVTVNNIFGKSFISVHAKKASLAEVATEVGNQLKAQVVLTDKAKKDVLTTDFDDFPLEAAIRRLSPHGVMDYVVSGGADPLRPSQKKVLAIYLLGQDEKVPDVPPWLRKDPGSVMFVGMIYATEEEEKQALEIKKKDLQVSYKEGLLSLHIRKQFLTDVLEEIAARAGISFTILTTDGQQKEIDQVVDWDIAAVTLEELTTTWFPSGIRLYCRTDLENNVSKPLRLTIEPNQDAQAEQNVTP